MRAMLSMLVAVVVVVVVFLFFSKLFVHSVSMFSVGGLKESSFLHDNCLSIYLSKYIYIYIYIAFGDLVHFPIDSYDFPIEKSP